MIDYLVRGAFGIDNLKLSNPPDSKGPFEWFQDRVALAEVLAEKLGILLVANVQGRTTPPDDYVGHSVVTEFLTSVELDNLLEGFEAAGLYCQAVLDEEGFLHWLNHERFTFPRKYVLVYNLAQNGTGPARLTLVPALCRLYHLPVVDSDSYGVALARHKFHSAAILRYCGLPVARSWWFTTQGWWPEVPAEGLRLIAKLTYESASIGIDQESTFTMRDDASKKLDHLVSTYRQPLTVQEFVPGFEVEVPVFETDEPSTAISVGIELNGQRNLGDSYLTYDDVAKNNYAFYNFGEEQPAAAEETMRVARRAFASLGLAGVGRVDLRVRSDGSPIIIEAACKPHLTRHSSFCFAVQSLSRPYTDLLKFLVGSAAIRHRINYSADQN
jgi:D-alanine-D-alanine ligase